MDLPPPSIAIRKATEDCRRCLEECVGIPRLMVNEWAENRTVDFNLWTAGIGALAGKNSSLDARLSSQPETSLVVVNLLILLKIFLERCKALASQEVEPEILHSPPIDQWSKPVALSRRSSLSSQSIPQRPLTPLSHISSTRTADISESDEPSDSGSSNASETDDVQPSSALAQARKNAENTLDNLTMVAFAIRRSGTSSRLLKADATFNPDSEEFLRLRNQLTFVLLAENRDPIAFKEPAEKTADGPAVFSTDASAMSEVQQRLVEACLRRYNRFRYAQTHATKLGTRHEVQVLEPTPEPRLLGHPPLPKDQPPGPALARLTSPQQPQAPLPARKGGVVSDTMASEAASPLHQMLVENPSPSQQSNTEISTNASRLQYPSPPKPVEPNSLLNHIAEHIHSFSLRSLPWPPLGEESKRAAIANSDGESYFNIWLDKQLSQPPSEEHTAITSTVVKKHVEEASAFFASSAEDMCTDIDEKLIHEDYFYDNAYFGNSTQCSSIADNQKDLDGSSCITDDMPKVRDILTEGPENLPPKDRIDQNPLDEPKVCLLALDGGGIRGLSMLLILKELMTRLNQSRKAANLEVIKPCHVFDLIAGTGVGGLIAIMLGRLEMDVNECISAFNSLALSCFKSGLLGDISDLAPEKGTKAIALARLAMLEPLIIELITARGFTASQPLNSGSSQKCKVFVCATEISVENPTRLRSYSLPIHDDLPATICEAALATVVSSMENFFAPVQIGTIKFADGDLADNNPVHELCREASKMWYHKPGDSNSVPRCLVSIGIGGEIQIDTPYSEMLQRSIIETNNTAFQFEKSEPGYPYFRFDVDRRLQDVGLAESESYSTVEAATQQYLTRKNDLDRCMLELDRTQEPGTLLSTNSKSSNQDVNISRIGLWLAPPDSSQNYLSAIKRWQPGTGLWLHESAKYLRWKISNTTSFLYLCGIPGSGKTILSSTIVQSLLQHCADNPGKAIAYFYFNFRDTEKRNTELMIGSLIFQLLQQCSKVPVALEALFSSCGNGQRQPSIDALLGVLQQVIKESLESYLIIDALNECTNRDELMRILEEIAGWRLEELHILVTSRREVDIETSLSHYLEDDNIIQMQSTFVDVDIRKYVQHRLSDDKSLAKWSNDPDIRDEIEKVVIEGAHGMFVWAVSHLDALGKCRTRSSVQSCLQTLPPALDEIYDRILCAITKENSVPALRIIQWLTFSKRLLSLEELSEAVAIDIERDPAFDSSESAIEPQDILHICCGLITKTTTEDRYSSRGDLEPPRSVVAFVHYSIKEYLLSERIRQGQAANYTMQAAVCEEILAKSCVGYLLQYQTQDSISAKSIETSKLARYSAEYWMAHAERAAAHGEHLGGQLFIDLLSSGNGAYLNWLRIHNPDAPKHGPNFERTLETLPTPLYYAALGGLTEIVRLLIVEVDADIRGYRGHYGNALQAASVEGHDRFVELLPSAGADVNAQGGYYSNALRAALAEGHDKLVELLLRLGANINAQGGHYGNALQAASAGGYDKTVELLLSAGAGVNAQGGSYGNALQAASAEGHDKIVELLLRSGAKVNAQGGYYGNALQAASFIGDEKIVELLLSAGADVNAQGGLHSNALEAASTRGHDKTVASAGGYDKIVELLLRSGADVNAQGGPYNNALQAASVAGQDKIVELLLKAGADVNAQELGRLFTSTLQVASVEGYDKIVELLLKAGADVNTDVNAQGGLYSNALQAASVAGHDKIVELLISAGAKRN
ncbi:hypothetical protein V493_00710 [Pseudogymnoascus sp. VKM F-4281 (FW-2241)]|nr:hypothetical protein V493_00710 [Pseudogymnoascus sp. VKM F-4281 (FW-2241)]